MLFSLSVSVKDMVVQEACQGRFLTHYYVGREILGGIGCETFFSLGHWWLFHNPAQQKPALGAAYLTFTNTPRALPVLRRIKDNLAMKWVEAFEQAPNTRKTSQHVANCTQCYGYTHV